MSTKDDLVASLKLQEQALQNSMALAYSLPDDVPGIKTSAEFDTAYAAAKSGDTLVLDPTLVYPSPFTFDKNGVVLKSSGYKTLRATAAQPMPSFQNAVTVVGTGCAMMGVDTRNSHLVECWVVNGANFINDNCRLMGDPLNGGKRGIAINAAGFNGVRGYIGDMKLRGQDAQALFCADSPGPAFLDDWYMEGASSCILFGGEDVAANVPTGITITNSTFAKPAHWQAEGWQVKNCVEFKSGRNVLLQNCELCYSWSGYSQNGYLLVLTPRNQDGGSPFISIENITVEQCTFHDAAGWMQLLGTDYAHPSGPLKTVTIKQNTISLIDPLKYAQPWAPLSAPQFLQLTVNGGQPTDVTIDSNEYIGPSLGTLGSALYVAGSGDGTKAQNFRLTNNKLPSTWFGIKGDGQDADLTLNNMNSLTWQTYMNGGALSGNTAVPYAGA